VGEGGGQATVSVTRTGGSGGSVSATYGTANGTATAPADYTATGGTLTWADGETATKTFTVPIIDDTLVEGDETVNLSLTSAHLGSQGTAVLTIVDNDVAPPPDTTGARVTSAAFSGTTTNSFNKVRVTFNEAMTANSFTAADVSVSGPAAAVVSQVVAVSATQFDVVFTGNVTTPGTYTVHIGPDVRDLAGNQMDQNQNGVNGENPADRFSVSTTLQYPPRQTFALTNLSVPIYDLSTSTVQITVPPTSVVNGLTISDLNVGITLDHTYMADLFITLTSPDGRTVTLFNRRGGSGDNMAGTVFNDEATTAISAGQAPFAGSFRPEQALSAFDGINPVGTWTLSVRDMARRDVGTIRAVSLHIATDPGDSMSGFSLGGAEQAGGTGSVGVGLAASFSAAATQLTAPQQGTQPTTPAGGFVVTLPAAPPTASSPSVAPVFGVSSGFQSVGSNWEGLTPRNAQPVFVVE
jgi:subtilisin-like proprotein convertase family protein